MKTSTLFLLIGEKTNLVELDYTYQNLVFELALQSLISDPLYEMNYGFQMNLNIYLMTQLKWVRWVFGTFLKLMETFFKIVQPGITSKTLMDFIKMMF